MHPLLSVLLMVASAADSAPPSISHAPVRRIDPDSALVIKAHISDPSGVFDPSVSWRLDGESVFRRAAMVAKGPGDFETTIPGANLRSKSVEYFIEAFDEQGNGPARFGNPDKPIRVAIASLEEMAGAPPAPAPASPPTPAPTAAPAPVAKAAPPVAPAKVLPPAVPPPSPQPVPAPERKTVQVPLAQSDPTPSVATAAKTTVAAAPVERESRGPVVFGVIAAVLGGAGILVVAAAVVAAGVVGTVLYLNATGMAPWSQPAQKGVSSVDIQVSGPSPAE